jgi:hypothetical protein
MNSRRLISGLLRLDRQPIAIGAVCPAFFGREPLALGIAYVRQERLYGGHRKATLRELDRLFERALAGSTGEGKPAQNRPPALQKKSQEVGPKGRCNPFPCDPDRDTLPA